MNTTSTLKLLVRFFFLILISFFSIDSYSQEDSTNIDSLIAAELEAEFSSPPIIADTLITDSSADFSNEYLINFCYKNGIGYDSVCTNLNLYKEMQGWLGVKYQYGGKTKKGIDCAALVSHLCNQIYGTQLAGSAGHHFEKCVEITQEDLEEGDLVFFKINKSYISHVGLYLGNGNFVHATVSKGVMINNLSEAYYKKYYFTSGRIKNTNTANNAQQNHHSSKLGN